MEFQRPLVRMPRAGPQPLKRDFLPPVQLNRWLPVDVHTVLLEQCDNLRHIAVQRSRMDPPDTLALRVLNEFANGSAQAFIDDHEFCYLHTLPEGEKLIPRGEVHWPAFSVLAHGNFPHQPHRSHILAFVTELARVVHD
jgi:hypothetical protein